MARNILIDELELPDETAWSILHSSLAAAHACAQKINRRAQDVFQGGSREQLSKIFARAANCTRRMTAAHRHALDRRVLTILHRETIDSEIIDNLIKILVTSFAKNPKAKSSLTVLRAVLPEAPSTKSLNEIDTTRLRRHFTEATDLLQEDYAALPALDQHDVESALTALVAERRAVFDTDDVCMTVSRVLASNGTHGISSSAAGIITDYVRAVGEVWKLQGLRAGRATREEDSTYRSKFHRFADLVLTDVVEPWARRHDRDQAERLARLREAHTELPKDVRRVVSAGLRRSDVEWLVNEKHVKRALRPAQKRAPKSP